MKVALLAEDVLVVSVMAGLLRHEEQSAWHGQHGMAIVERCAVEENCSTGWKSGGWLYLLATFDQNDARVACLLHCSDKALSKHKLVTIATLLQPR